MNKQDAIYRFISERFMAGKTGFTQKDIATELSLSLSTVNLAIKKLNNVSAVKVYKRSFDVIDFSKLMLFWATRRNLNKDIVYKTASDLPVHEIERSMPNNIAFTAYSAFKYLLGNTPADYSQVYVYADSNTLNEIRIRFPERKGIYNLFVLLPDVYLSKSIESKNLKNSSVSIPQIFVDLWNINNWYSKDFIDALEKRMNI